MLCFLSVVRAVICLCGASIGYKKVSDPLELELQIVVSSSVGCRTQVLFKNIKYS